MNYFIPLEKMEKSVLEFRTEKGSRYILDSNTGTIMPVNNLLEHVIDLFGKLTKEEIVNHQIINNEKMSLSQVEGIYDFVERWNDCFGGIYINNKENEVKNFNMDNFDENTLTQFYDSGNAYQLILNLTEDCNLRCKYCYLSEEYNYTRNRTSSKMSSDIGKKAISGFLSQFEKVSEFNPGKKLIITFYGGEPLLEFELMKELLAYSKSKSPLPITFNLTSNGVLFTEEVMDFVVENNIYVAISLDGTKENHDRNRVFSNGEGSFEIVMRNLKKFAKKYPDYKMISLISVYDSKTNLIDNDIFFENNSIPPVSFVNGVSTINTSYYNAFTQADFEKSFSDYQTLLHKYVVSKKNKTKISEYVRVLIEGQLCGILIRSRKNDLKSPMLPYTGTCVPGMKTSVRTDGTFDMCERVNQTFSIGNINVGLELTKIKDVIDKYNNQITRECYSCSVRNQCNLCFALCMGDNEFTRPSPCTQIQDNIRYNLSIIYNILEDNPTAFSDFNDNFSIQWFFNN